MDHEKAGAEKTSTPPKSFLASLSTGQHVLIGATLVGALTAAGWFGSGVLAPSVEIGAAYGVTPVVSIKDCDSLWLHQQVDRLRKRCHLGNIKRLGPAEGTMYERYEALQLEYRAVVEHQNIQDPEVRKDNHSLWWPEEAAVRQQVAALSASDKVQSLAFAEKIYLGRMEQLSITTASVKKSIDFAKAKAQARPAAGDAQPSPYSITPDATSSAITVPIVGKSGPFNVYAIEPKDDLDALHYFVGNYRVEPDMLVGMLPVIEKSTAEQHGLKCQFLCADGQGNIVGRKRINADDNPGK